MSKNTAGIIILSIISLGGLGLGGYTFITTLAPPQVVDHTHPVEGTILVGVWDETYRNTDFAGYTSDSDWLLELGGNEMNNSEYVSISRNNTRITLLKPGWYRLHLSLVLGSIGPSATYWTSLRQNDAIEIYMDRHQTSATPESSYHVIDSSAFVYSNGTDYFELNGDSAGDVNFYPENNAFNQLAIEYFV